MDQPGSSKTDPNTTKSDKEHDLEAARRNFETTQSTPNLKVNIAVRRRRRALRHVATDLLFVVTFSESDAGELPVLSCLIGVYETILTLIRKLKSYFNDQKRRLCYFSAIPRIDLLYFKAMLLMTIVQRVFILKSLNLSKKGETPESESEDIWSCSIIKFSSYFHVVGMF